jgi:hypothetical protein
VGTTPSKKSIFDGKHNGTVAPARIFWTRWVDVLRQPVDDCRHTMLSTHRLPNHYANATVCSGMPPPRACDTLFHTGRFVDHKLVSNEYSLIITQAQHKQHKHNTSNTSTPQCKHNTSTTQATHWKPVMSRVISVTVNPTVMGCLCTSNRIRKQAHKPHKSERRHGIISVRNT